MVRIETFEGKWTVEVVSHAPQNTQRAVIRVGAQQIVLDNTIGGHVDVDGQQWTIMVEWRPSPKVLWNGGYLEPSPSYTVQSGLVMLLGAAETEAGPFTSLVLRCRHTDPASIPWRPVTAPLDFTVPRHGGRPTTGTHKPVRPGTRPRP